MYIVKDSVISAYYNIWNTHLVTLQRLPNVFIYVCGKGILFELIGKGVFTGFCTGPTAVHAVQQHTLKAHHIQAIIKGTPRLKLLYDLLDSFNQFEEFSQFVYDRTSGIPIMIYFALMARPWRCKAGITMESMKKKVITRLETNEARVFVDLMGSLTR